MTNMTARPGVEEQREPDYRFTLANERTFLAWQRTSLGLLAAALASLHFLSDTRVVAYLLGGGLGALATVTALGGLMHWRRSDGAIRRGAPLPASRMPELIAATLGLIGVAAAVAAAVAAGIR
ncbi:hypothetical protein GCM10022231_03310 [Gordonia caeni]|uniref:DUF202 domain-containing protein n=2 Tax=Gordonia caeni TaxID=1007097 RepID=A0ABP7NM38_9ACTN